MIEEYSELGKIWDTDSLTKLSELHEEQAEYLKELNIPSDVWSGMDKLEQERHLSLIMDRFSEMDIAHDIDKGEVFTNLFSSDILESYRQLEAPHDFVQIERISDVMADCKDLDFEHWRNLELEDKVEVLNNLEMQIAEIEHRSPCPVYVQDLGSISIGEGGVSGYLGGYDTKAKDITLNVALLESSQFVAYQEILDTLIHEGRHAYQDYNANVCEVHPRHSEVESWHETMEGGKWGYYGDTSTELGQRLYEQQSVEIDARNFAADVLDKFEQKMTV